MLSTSPYWGLVQRRDAIWMAESRLHSYPLLTNNTDMVFVELPTFVRCAAELFSDEDIAGLQNILLFSEHFLSHSCTMFLSN